mmetsp:Transcript_5130/g.10803  ORF Transcript_5130/g.10803 Transcript_5130/m.10803 type:complete len:102 (+) Transcript_5130:921-1226(+)
MKFSKMLRPTWASTAASGSSSSQTEAFEYAARAIETLIFWPPDRFTPLSPISVFSPSGSCLRSSLISARSTASSKSFLSNGLPKVTFSMTVELMMKACWET